MHCLDDIVIRLLEDPIYPPRRAKIKSHKTHLLGYAFKNFRV
jgi:hypothetical protein